MATPFAVVREILADLVYPEGRERRNNAERLANTDPLTGVANRRALALALPGAESDPGVSVLLFDLNNFGQVNKLWGHAVGDRYLRSFATTIEHCASWSGVAGRVFRSGGDEFVVLAPAVAVYAIREAVEREFGRHAVGPHIMSASGTIGATLDEADAALQTRKSWAKGMDA